MHQNIKYRVFPWKKACHSMLCLGECNCSGSHLNRVQLGVVQKEITQFFCSCDRVSIPFQRSYINGQPQLCLSNRLRSSIGSFLAGRSCFANGWGTWARWQYRHDHCLEVWLWGSLRDFVEKSNMASYLSSLLCKWQIFQMPHSIILMPMM